jgi:hypothetical protein
MFPTRDPRGGVMECAKKLFVVAALTLALSGRVVAQVPSQGVKVHGHWVIEVRNADGTLHVRREFENAFVGQRILAYVLSGQAAMGGWLVVVSGGAEGGGLCNSPFDARLCRMVEPTSSIGADSWTFKNLTKTVTTNFELVLHGSFVVANRGSITGVMTQVSPPGNTFSSAAPAATDVEATQTVSVTVTFTFS